jgi:hypothetical protein
MIPQFAGFVKSQELEVSPPPHFAHMPRQEAAPPHGASHVPNTRPRHVNPLFQVEFDSPGKGLNVGQPAPEAVLVPGLT